MVSESDTERQMPYDPIFMWDLRWSNTYKWRAEQGLSVEEERGSVGQRDTEFPLRRGTNSGDLMGSMAIISNNIIPCT